jgi:catechol-2,3-dioxygenase
MHHTAFEYATLDELLGSYLRIKNEGIEPIGCLDHGLTMSFYYVDPDGNCVELQADNHGDWAQSTEFMRSDERFAADPIGKPIEPLDLVEARRSGLSVDEVHERAYRGDYPPKGSFDLRLGQ